MDLQNNGGTFYHLQPQCNPTNATLFEMSTLCSPPSTLTNLENIVVPSNPFYVLQPQSNPTNATLPHLSPPSPPLSLMDFENSVVPFEPFYDLQPLNNQTSTTHPQISRPNPPPPSLMEHDNFVVPFEPFYNLQPQRNPPNENLPHKPLPSPPPKSIMAFNNFVAPFQPFQPFFVIQHQSNSTNATLADGLYSNFEVLPQNNVFLGSSVSLTSQNHFHSFSFSEESMDPTKRHSHLVAFGKGMPVATKINSQCAPANNDIGEISKSLSVKGSWSQDEDSLLLRGVENHGENWYEIAKKIQGRNRKQCRERWLNHLRPNVKKSSWSEDEDRILFHLHSELGNKWTEIAKSLPGRTDNSIKNRWNSAKRKLLSQQKRRSPNKGKANLLI